MIVTFFLHYTLTVFTFLQERKLQGPKIWAFKSPLQLLIRARLWLIQSLCSSSPAPSEGRSKTMAESSSSVCPSSRSNPVLSWNLPIPLLLWSVLFLFAQSLSCCAVTCGHKGVFALGLLVSGSLLGDGVGNANCCGWVSLFLSTAHGPPAAEECTSVCN